MRDVEQWREEFEVLAKAKGLNLERKPHAFVDVEYYVSKQTLWLWSGYIAGRRAGIVSNIAKLPPEQTPIIGVQPDKPWPRGELPEPPPMRIGEHGDTIDRAGVRRKANGSVSRKLDQLSMGILMLIICCIGIGIRIGLEIAG